MDWQKQERLRLDGASDKVIADALGIGRRTMNRRIAVRPQQADPGW
jgi:hypothetical protein